MRTLLNTYSKRLFCALLIFISFSGSAQSSVILKEADAFFKKGKLNEAQEIYLQYASDLSLDQQSNLGMTYASLETNSGYTSAMEWFQKAAAKGHTSSMTLIGSMYQDGLGVLKDTVTSFKWYKKAADLKDKDALLMMGAMYQLGINTKADESQAIYWYKKAGENGNLKGYYYLGDIYFKKELYNTAVDWFRKGADWGEGYCLMKLARMYQEGNGVIKDEDEAMLLYKQIEKYGSGGSTWSSNVTYKQALYAREQLSKMGSVPPSSNSNQLKPALWQIASGFGNSFSGLFGKSFTPADKNRSQMFSEDTYYRCTVNTGLKNAYIKKEVMRDVNVPGYELRKGTYYYYNADVVTNVNQVKADEVYTEWVNLLKAVFPNFSVRTSTENGKAHYFSGYVNGKEIIISLYTCCPARNDYNMEVGLSMELAR